MKKINQILLCTVLLGTTVFTSCKKTSDPGPAGANGINGTNGTNGTNGNAFPYKQEGTSLNLTGNFYSDDASFDKLIQMPYFTKLDENSVTVSAPVLRQGNSTRTSAAVNDYEFYITRYDSLGNSQLYFEIYYDGEDTYVDEFYFNVKTNVTETSYKKVYTTFNGGAFRVTGPNDQDSELTQYDMTNDGNSFTISSWNYNETTNELSFDYSGMLTGNYNSTGNDLTLSGTVKANVKNASLRIAQ